MGRKIPGKKHKGVKDPDKQRAVRNRSIQDKINTPPVNPQDQAIPKSLQKLIDFKQRLIAGQVSLQRKRSKFTKGLITTEPRNKQKPSKRLSKNPIKPAANFTQLPGENSRTFMIRVNQTVQSYLKESQFEDKYGVTVKRNSVTGEIEGVEKKPKDEFDELLRESKLKHGDKKTKKKKENAETRLTKTQKKNLKVADKKEKRLLAKVDEFDKFKDDIKFGEIVHAPPTLSVPKKISKNNGASRPGKKDLLLNSVLPQSVPAMKHVGSSANKKISQKIGTDIPINKKGKRKELPIAIRRQLENQQSEVVQAYKLLKKNTL